MTDASTESPIDTAPVLEAPKRAPGAASVAFLLRLTTAATDGGLRGFYEDSSATVTSHRIAESSTAQSEVSHEFREKLERIVKAARHQVISDGMSNEVTNELNNILREQTAALVPALVGILEHRRTPPVVAAEILKELGRSKDKASHAFRLWVLEYALRAPSPLTRDGAGLGLARLADRDALDYIKAAIERETIPAVRDDLKLVADEIESLGADGIPGPGGY